MSGVFDFEPNREPACRFRTFGCPKCGANHKFGHKRHTIQCWRCWTLFCPTNEGRKYEEERLTNLSPEERQQAIETMNSPPPWKKNKKRKSKKKAEQPPPPPKTWFDKIIDFFKK